MMRVVAVTSVLALLCLPVGAQSPTVQRARELRQSLGEVMNDPSSGKYASYFALFPGSLAEFQELFATQKYSALLEQGLSEGSTGLYFTHACKAYKTVGAERYVAKFLEIAAQAGSWGGPQNRANDARLMAGHLFQNLLFRADCHQLTPTERAELHTAIIENVARSDDARVEQIYVSLGWDGMEGSGMEWWGPPWLLEGVCNHAPERCAHTQRLAEKYKSLVDE